MIEKKIKDEFNRYEIKTTSNDILSHVKQKKPLFSFNLKFASIAVSFAVVVLLVLIPILNPTPSDKPVYIENKPSRLSDSGVLSRASLEMYYGASMMSDEGISNINNNQYFNEARNKYEAIEDVINEFYQKSKEGMVSIYESVEFNYEKTLYKYKLSVENYAIYSVKDFNKENYEGKILVYINDKYYRGCIEIETEKKESEVTLVYEDDYYIYEIEKEAEKKEFSIEYKVTDKKTRKEIEHEMSIEDEGRELELEYEYQNELTGENYSFEIIENKNIRDITYENGNIKIEMIYNLDTKEYYLQEN